MFYKFLNRLVSSEISELHPRAIKYLNDELDKEGNETVARRLKVFSNYALLKRHFEKDEKSVYMINKNYRSFLKAIIFLYRTSQMSVSVGILNAPTGIYQTINDVEASFEELVISHHLRDSLK